MNIKMLKKIGLTMSSNRYRFGSITETGNYPYKFGGIECQRNNQQLQTINKTIFKYDINTEFKGAYKSILEGLRDKDKKFLQQSMQKTLINKITFPDVQLINQNSNIEVDTHKCFFVFGGRFDRSQNQNISNVGLTNNNFQMYLCPSGLMKMTQCALLYGLRVYFRSDMKLVNKGQNSNNKNTQCHMLQFQIQSKLSITNLFSLMGKITGKSKNSPPSQKQLTEVFQMLVGDNYEWKIGDMDNTLKGNLKIQPGGFNLGKFGMF